MSPDKIVLRAVAAALCLAVLAGCSSRPSGPGAATGYSRSGAGIYKVGKPYQIGGVWYYPAEDYYYDETGVASWYGPGFNRQRTANGEIYDQGELTAAHRTLPMPCLVRVTNLENGRSLVVRINDRGPYAAGRIIDMSQRGAELLGFERTGTAKVRVSILAEESRAIAMAAKANTPPEQLAAEIGPPPAAAPRQSVEVASLTSDRSSPPPPVSSPRPMPSAVAPPPVTVAGADVDGRFLPAPVVSQVQVGGSRRLFVQAGAFTVPANANRLNSRMAAFGSSQVLPARVGSTQFYRVRIGPIDSVEQADAVLAKVIQAGNNDARVIVD
ncbi:MAG: septal ring lytic transglycosylase RlpA family protein [Azospirillum sp.]|nr:septal ring lytic transglycosylase RlpA family protein [Azospirillum sp.]